jgi:signal transduction histidine kinase
MKQKQSIFNRGMIIRQVVIGAIAGAFMGALLALIAAPEVLLDFVITWAIGGAVFGLFNGLGRESLWTQIAGINGIIIVATFAVAFLVLPIDFDEVGWFIGIVIIAGYGMALVVSFIVTRPLRILAESTQAIGEQNLSERVPIEGAREIRELAQSFNGMAEALQAAETRRQQLLADVSHELRTPLTVLQAICGPSSMTFMTRTKSKCSRFTAKRASFTTWLMISTILPRPMSINCRSTKPTST